MRLALDIDEATARALLELTGTTELEEAVVIALEHLVHKARLERLRGLREEVDIVGNEELEAADLERTRQLWGEPLLNEKQDDAAQSHSELESRTALIERLRARYADVEGSLADELIAEGRGPTAGRTTREAQDEG